MLKLGIPDVSVDDCRCRKFLNLAIFIDVVDRPRFVTRCGNSVFFLCCADVFLDAQRICCEG
jgi:hypothetical protein